MRLLTMDESLRIDAILRERFPESDGFVQRGEEFDFINVAYDDGMAVVDEVLATQDSYMLSEAKKAANLQLTASIEQFPVKFFAGGDPNKLEEYKRKQSAVADWAFTDAAPRLAVSEWEYDWLLRDEVIAAEGVAEVESLGQLWLCDSPEKLAATWKLNAELAKYLAEESLGRVRKRTSYLIEKASNESEVDALLAGVETQLLGIVAEFGATIAPGLIVDSKLVPAN